MIHVHSELSFFVGINKILFFTVKCPPPLKNRDFVTQRSWLDLGAEKCIVNHSVNHKVNNRKSLLEATHDKFINSLLIKKKQHYSYICR